MLTPVRPLAGILGLRVLHTTRSVEVLTHTMVHPSLSPPSRVPSSGVMLTGRHHAGYLGGGEDYFNHMAGGFVDLHDNNASVFSANGSYVLAHPGV